MVTVWERFEDALSRRAEQTSSLGMDYKVGFYENFLKGLVERDPKIAAEFHVATKLIEQWADEHEARNRKWDRAYQVDA